MSNPDHDVSVEWERIRKRLQRRGYPSEYLRPYRVTTGSHHDKPLATKLRVRRFERWAANRAWVAGATYIARDEGPKRVNGRTKLALLSISKSPR